MAVLLYIGVIHPVYFSTHLRLRKIYIFAILNWILAVVVSVPTGLFQTAGYVPGPIKCDSQVCSPIVGLINCEISYCMLFIRSVSDRDKSWLQRSIIYYFFSYNRQLCISYHNNHPVFCLYLPELSYSKSQKTRKLHIFPNSSPCSRAAWMDSHSNYSNQFSWRDPRESTDWT